MPHRQFSAPSVRPAHSCYPPAALPVCPTILLSTHPHRLLIGLPAPPIRAAHLPHRPLIPYPSAHISALPIRAACSLARPFVCTATCPPPRLHRLPRLRSFSCLRGLPHHLLIHALRLSAPSVPLSAYPLACRHVPAANTGHPRKHHATDTHPTEITDKYLFLRPEYNYL